MRWSLSTCLRCSRQTSSSSSSREVHLFVYFLYGGRLTPHGTGELDDNTVAEWKDSTIVRGSATEQQKAEHLEWLFQIIRDKSFPERAAMLEFFTGFRRAPGRGFGSQRMTLNISPGQDVWPHTCASSVDFPVFTSMEEMRWALDSVVGSGFTRL